MCRTCWPPACAATCSPRTGAGGGNEMIDAVPPRQCRRIFAARVFLCAGADFHGLGARMWALAACEARSSSATTSTDREAPRRQEGAGRCVGCKAASGAVTPCGEQQRAERHLPLRAAPCSPNSTTHIIRLSKFRVTESR